jgi:hypothetical protein
LRERIVFLEAEVLKLRGQQKRGKHGKSVKSNLTIPEEYEKYTNDIRILSRKAAMSLVPWPLEVWLQHRKRPDVDPNNPVWRYLTKKNEELANVADLYDYVKLQPNGRKFCKFIGKEQWFGELVCVPHFICPLLTVYIVR